MDYLFFYISRSAFNLEKKQKHFLRKTFGSPDTSNQTFFFCFSNYAYLKDMYINLKEIEKILFVLVLRILLTCKFLNLMAVFTKKI